MGALSCCHYRILPILSLLVLIGYLGPNAVSGLSAKNHRSNNNNGIVDPSSRSVEHTVSSSSISRRDWLVNGSIGVSGLLWSESSAAAAVTSDSDTSAASAATTAAPPLRPRLGQEYYSNPPVSDPGAGRSYFPALTPPFQNRATFRYDLGRNAWALEQLLTLANVTATIRCNVVRLESTGGLWVSSPQWPTGEFCSLLDGIGGPVEHVVLPCNAFEHKAPMQAFLEKYPNTKVWIAPGQYGPLGSCGTTLSSGNKPSMGYRVDGILGDQSNPPPPWSNEFDIATLYVDLPRNAGPVSEVAFCHRPTKTLITTDAVVYIPNEASKLLSTYFDQDTLESPNFWSKSVLQAVFLPLRGVERSSGNIYYPGYEALVDKLVRAPILRAVVDARAPNAVKDWILEQTTTTTTTTTVAEGTGTSFKNWDYDRIITGHFASPIAATPSDVRASFDYLFKEDLSGNSNLPPIACKDWDLLDSINQFIAKYNAGEPAVFDFQRGCVAD